MDIDVTFLVQFGILLGLMAVMQPLLHRPLLDVMAAREQQTIGTMAEVRRMEKLTAVDRAAYEERLRSTRLRAHAERERLRQAGRDEARAIEAQARGAMVQARQASRLQHDALEVEALQQIEPTRQRWRQTLVQVALGRAPKPSTKETP